MHIAPSALEPDAEGDVSGPPVGPVEPPRGGPRRGRPQRALTFLALLAAVAGAGAVGVIRAADQQVDKIARVDGLTFSAPSPDVENYLLVGSDSRVGADPSDPDFGAIGDESATGGSNRSDTIMILRRDRHGAQAALLSLPRDLYLYIPALEREERINAAYTQGPQALIDTVTQTLQIPVHHYIEVDFQGFKSLVDAIGGVEVCAETPIRDVHTGLNQQAGCHQLDGVQGLAYARSRHFETLDEVTGVWTEDPLSDLGRIKRQQAFINTALQGAIARIKANPLDAGDVLVSSTGALTLDAGLDVLGAASALREAVGSGLQPFTYPNRPKTVDGKAVLLPTDEGIAYIAYFAGTTTTPPVPA